MLFPNVYAVFSQWNAKDDFFINLHKALFHNVTICNDLSSSKRTKKILKVVFVTCVLYSKSCESLCKEQTIQWKSH